MRDTTLVSIRGVREAVLCGDHEVRQSRCKFGAAWQTLADFLSIVQLKNTKTRKAYNTGYNVKAFIYIYIFFFSRTSHS